MNTDGNEDQELNKEKIINEAERYFPLGRMDRMIAQKLCGREVITSSILSGTDLGVLETEWRDG